MTVESDAAEDDEEPQSGYLLTLRGQLRLAQTRLQQARAENASLREEVGALRRQLGIPPLEITTRHQWLQARLTAPDVRAIARRVQNSSPDVGEDQPDETASG